MWHSQRELRGRGRARDMLKWKPQSHLWAKALVNDVSILSIFNSRQKDRK